MMKKIWLWLLIGLSGFFLVFRAVTPFWLDMTGIVVALLVIIWSKFLPLKNAKQGQPEQRE